MVCGVCAGAYGWQAVGELSDVVLLVDSFLGLGGLDAEYQIHMMELRKVAG